MLLNYGVGEGLRILWTARRSNQSILKEISLEYSLEGLILKLKLQYFGQLMWRTDSLERTLMLGKIEGSRRRGWQRMRWFDGIADSRIWVWVNSGSWWWTGRPGVLQSTGSQRVGHYWVTEPSWTYRETVFWESGPWILVHFGQNATSEKTVSASNTRKNHSYKNPC